MPAWRRWRACRLKSERATLAARASQTPPKNGDRGRRRRSTLGQHTRSRDLIFVLPRFCGKPIACAQASSASHRPFGAAAMAALHPLTLVRHAQNPRLARVCSLAEPIRHPRQPRCGAFLCCLRGRATRSLAPQGTRHRFSAYSLMEQHQSHVPAPKHALRRPLFISVFAPHGDRPASCSAGPVGRHIS